MSVIKVGIDFGLINSIEESKKHYKEIEANIVKNLNKNHKYSSFEIDFNYVDGQDEYYYEIHCNDSFRDNIEFAIKAERARLNGTYEMFIKKTEYNLIEDILEKVNTRFYTIKLDSNNIVLFTGFYTESSDPSIPAISIEIDQTNKGVKCTARLNNKDVLNNYNGLLSLSFFQSLIKEESGIYHIKSDDLHFYSNTVLYNVYKRLLLDEKMTKTLRSVKFYEFHNYPLYVSIKPNNVIKVYTISEDDLTLSFSTFLYLTSSKNKETFFYEVVKSIGDIYEKVYPIELLI